MAGSASGTYTWASATSTPPAPWAAGVFGWAATAVGQRNPVGSDSGTYTFASAISAPLAPWAAGVFKWSSAATGSRTPKASGHGVYKMASHAGGIIPSPPVPPEPPLPENVGLLLVEISSALNDLGDSTSTPDPRITPAVAMLSKVNSEWLSNPTQAATDANNLALMIGALLASYPTANRLADALDCAQQLAGTWSGDDYV